VGEGSSPRALGPRRPSRPRACGVAPCAVAGCGTCAWGRVAVVCLVSLPPPWHTHDFTELGGFFSGNYGAILPLAGWAKWLPPNTFICAVTHFVAPWLFVLFLCHQRSVPVGLRPTFICLLTLSHRHSPAPAPSSSSLGLVGFVVTELFLACGPAATFSLRSSCAPARPPFDLLYHASPARADGPLRWCLLLCPHVARALCWCPAVGFLCPRSLGHTRIDGRTRYLLPCCSSSSAGPRGASPVDACGWGLPQPALQVRGLQGGTSTPASASPFPSFPRLLLGADTRAEATASSGGGRFNLLLFSLQNQVWYALCFPKEKEVGFLRVGRRARLLLNHAQRTDTWVYPRWRLGTVGVQVEFCYIQRPG